MAMATRKLATLVCLVLAGGALSQPAIGGEEDVAAGVPSPGVVTLALFDEAPVVDGEIGEEEWGLAAQSCAFHGGGGRPPWAKKRGGNPHLHRYWLEGRTGVTRVGYTRERLYIAVSTALPPDNKLIAGQNNQDAVRTVFDSGIEIWIADMRDDRIQYQMIANSIGAIFDAKKQPGAPDVGWRGDWEYANAVDTEAGWWHAELSLPFADFGGEGDVVGETVKLMIARNFKRPWNQASWFPQGTFKDPGGYTRLHLTRDGPVMQLMRLGEYDGEDLGPLFTERHLDVRARIVNPGPARGIVVEARAHCESMPSVEENKELTLPAEGVVDYAFEVPSNQFHDNVSNWFTLAVRTPETKAPLFQYGMAWNKPKPKPKAVTWNVSTEPKPHLAAQMAYYPTYHVLKVRLDPRKLLDLDTGSTRAELTLADAEGNIVLESTLEWEKGDIPLVRELELPPLEPGDYTFSCKFDKYDNALSQTFERKYFAWEGNQLGISTDVIPPFTPVEVEGDRVNVVLRRHRMTGLGLWASVEARGQDANEGYKELLAGPMQLVADDGEALEGTGAFTRTAPHQVVYEGEAKHPAVNVRMKSTIEMDGCMRVELTLAPGEEKRELKRLRLRIPMRDEMHPLYHLCTTRLRINPAGAAPEGEGRIWDSDDFPNGVFNKNFVPYLWFGGPARGLCWFADNDKGWVVHTDRKKPETTLPPQELFREDGVLTLQLNLVQKPVTLQEPRTIVFGLMASPAKPMPDDWRAFGRPEHPGVLFTSGFRGKHGMQGNYPINGDWSFWSSAQARRLGYGKGRPETERYLKHLKKTFVHHNLQGWPDYAKGLLTFRGGSGSRLPKAGGYMSVYFEEYHSTSIFHEEAPTFYSEWSGRYLRRSFPEMPPKGREHSNSFLKGFAVNCGALAPSYRDFACWHAADWLRRGYGLYFDNTFPMADFDILTTTAYRTAEGGIQPSAGIWARRSYQRRIWTLHRHLHMPKLPTMMMLHMTNSHIVPYMVWNDANVDLEWKKGPRPTQTRFSPELLRAESIGRQSGCLASGFPKCTGDTQAKISSRMAFLVHEIFPGFGASTYPAPVADFGLGLEDCRVSNYWDDGPPLETDDPLCKWLMLRRNGELMVVLATWNPNATDVTLVFDKAILPSGAPRSDSFLMSKSGQRMDSVAAALGGDRVTVPLTAYGYRLVHIR